MKINTFGPLEEFLLVVIAIIVGSIAYVYATTDRENADGTKKSFRERLTESSVSGVGLIVLAVIALLIILGIVIYIAVYLANYNANPYNR